MDLLNVSLSASLRILNPTLFMPAASFSQLDSIVNKARETQSLENKDAAVDDLLSFAVADNPKQRIKASTLLPEFHEICGHRKSIIHEAIFDLCEDPLEHVRIAGYHAIVDLSKRASSVRRKNADVLCQLLQSEGASELAVVRGCLSQHVRIAPEITYSIMAEYVITKDGTKYARGPLMGVILSFLDGGGIGHSWHNSAYAVSSNEAMEAFRQRDVEGGKGALLEVSWLQKNAAADAILRKCLLSALSCATLGEAQTITSGILSSLSSECTPLGKDATDLLLNIIHTASIQSKKEITNTPETMDKSLSWLELAASTVSPVISPVPSFEPDPALPRADPTPLLNSCRERILPAMWSNYARGTQLRITSILGAALHASSSILNSGRRIKDGNGAPLTSALVAARNDMIDSLDQVMQSWIDLNAYDADPQACQAMLELVQSIIERKADSEWRLTSEQTTRLQSLRKVALRHAGGAGFNQFREVLRLVDVTIASPPVVVPSPKTTPVVSSPVIISPVASLPPTREGSNDVASRKRLRKEIESADMPHQSSLSGDERSVKRQKVVQPQHDLLSRIIKHRAPVLPPIPLATSVASQMEQDPDRLMTEVRNPKKWLPVDISSMTTGLSIKGAAATRISIKGAAATITKVAEKGNHSLQPPRMVAPGNSPSTQLPRPPTVTREPSISSAMQTLRIQPTPSSSANPMDGTRPRPSPQSPPEIQDSLKRLLLGKPREPPPRETEAHPTRKTLPSLLERIQGETGSLRPQAPAPTIFDRVGIPPKIRGINEGPRNNGPKKREM